ncbi:MAG: DUF3237 domain-containing protein [Rhodospirillaceae bacterium]|nr:DUF3237 domain-containing protein [Rhodospirillaceae bacterium]
MLPNLAMQWVMRLEVEIGPERRIGPVPAGERIDYPIIGGSFAGPDIRGDVLPGGADYFLMRHDGVGVLDARYKLRSDDGVVIDIHNSGLWVPTDAGRARMKSGLDPLPWELYCRCTPVFRAPTGRHDRLNRWVFTGSVDYPRPGIVVVNCFKLI